MDIKTASFEELKEYAKEKGIRVGNISKEKLITKIEESEKMSTLISEDDDLKVDVQKDVEVKSEKPKSTQSLLESISSTLDELDDHDDSIEDARVELPADKSIPVRSITFGTLVYKSAKTGAITTWRRIGEVQHLTVGELIEMNNQKSAFLNNPLVILLDEDAIKYFRLTHIYENVAEINNLKQLFKSDRDTIAKTIDKALLADMRDVLISRVRTMYRNGSLTDINIIRLLEDKLKFDLSDDN